MPRSLRFTLALLVLMLAPNVPAHGATGSLSEVVAVLVKDITAYLSDKEKGLSIDSFQPDSSKDAHVVKRSSAGVAILQELKRQLDRAGIKVTPNSKVKLDGTFIEVEDDDDQRQAVRLTLKLTDGNSGQSISLSTKYKHNYDVTNEVDIGHLTGVPVAYPDGAESADRIKSLKKAIDSHSSPNKPQVVLEGNRILAEKDGRFAIEVLVARPGTRKTYRPSKPFNDAGFAAVKIDRNDLYAVKLVNNADFDVAVSLSIDGLSVFSASDKEGIDPKTKAKVALRDAKTGRPLFHHVLVPKKGAVTVHGWFINLTQTDEFKVTSYARSLSAELKSTAPTGQITACFHAAVPPNQPLPPGEPLEKAHSQDADATGRGARIDKTYTVEQRKIGALRATVSVRYSKGKK